MKHSRLLAIISIILSLFIICLVPLAQFVKPYFPFANYLLGIGQPTSYLVLLGNDAEMRANGGFAGSYAKVVIANHEVLKQPPTSNNNLLSRILHISPTIDLSFQDIYVPNGQLKGYVTPPQPVQDAFQHGTWQLANADYEPDFPTAANSIRWFMEKGNEIDPDNLIILNLTTIKKVLDVIDSFSVPQFQAEITPDNLYLFLQGKAELNFFPGSTQKKDALTAVGGALKQRLLSLPLSKKLRVAKILYQDLVNQNIVVNSKNEAFQDLLEKKNFAGKLTPVSTDTYSFIEINLGANKSNAFVKRQTDHTITFSDNQVTHKVAIKLTNTSTEANPNPPFYYGGNYIAYFRFYIPSNAQNIHLDREVPTKKDKESEKYKLITASKFGFTELGFWQTTLAQGQSTINLSYTLPISQKDYSLTILKQNGLVSSPQTIKIEDKTYTSSLETDFSLTL